MLHKTTASKDVMVRTVASTQKTCPLLVSIETRSIADIENETRAIILQQPGVKSVGKVTVHFIDTALLDIEAVVGVDEGLSLKDAKVVARSLRGALKDKGNGIHQVDIYFDSTDEYDSSGKETGG